METLEPTICVEYSIVYNTAAADVEKYVAAMVCERANAFNHTIEAGIKIENVEVCNE